MKSLSTEYGLFVVSFHGVSNQFIFDGNSDELGNLIQQYGKHGINFIGQYYASKLKFIKLSKNNIRTLFSWNTHAMEQLKNINFIK